MNLTWEKVFCIFQILAVTFLLITGTFGPYMVKKEFEFIETLATPQTESIIKYNVSQNLKHNYYYFLDTTFKFTVNGINYTTSLMEQKICPSHDDNCVDTYLNSLVPRTIHYDANDPTSINYNYKEYTSDLNIRKIVGLVIIGSLCIFIFRAMDLKLESDTILFNKKEETRIIEKKCDAIINNNLSFLNGGYGYLESKTHYDQLSDSKRTSQLESKNEAK
jgi:hypothetical protein